MRNIISTFIIENLERISKSIKGINLKYAYDWSSDFHIIEASPESTRRGMEEYIIMEADLWARFNDRFPDENILITEVSEINNMGNMLFEAQYS